MGSDAVKLRAKFINPTICFELVAMIEPSIHVSIRELE